MKKLRKTLDMIFQILSNQIKLPIDAKIGPTALARAPIDRNMPSTIPF